MSHGVAEIGFACRDGTTRLAHLYQRDPLRVLFPRAEEGEPPVAAIVTTSGGLVAGDRLDIAVRLGPGAAAHVTASAAEKVYRSTGPDCTVRQTLTVSRGAWLEFLPPETILFERARLRRETVVALMPGAGFLGGGILVFGRRARGERLTRGLVHEVWRVERNGVLAWGDALHLDGDIAALADDPACLAGAAACATLVLCLPDADPRDVIGRARAVQARAATAGVPGGVTALAGLLVARWLAADPAALRRVYADTAAGWREIAGRAPVLPRLWAV